jgi:hypothetical protein
MTQPREALATKGATVLQTADSSGSARKGGIFSLPSFLSFARSFVKEILAETNVFSFFLILADLLPKTEVAAEDRAKIPSPSCWHQ